MPETSKKRSNANAKRTSSEKLLIEMRCEEMPPALIHRAAYELAAEIVCGLHHAGLLVRDEGFDPDALKKNQQLGFWTVELINPSPNYFDNEWGMKVGVSSRRIAVFIGGVKPRTPASSTTKRGPTCDQSQKALNGFLRANKATKNDLIQITSEVNEKEYFALKIKTPAMPLAKQLGSIIERAIKSLSLPRSMRWGDSEHKFLRPIRGWCIVHGTKPVGAVIHDIKAGNITEGHRFLAAGEEIVINNADAKKYLEEMRKGKVLLSRDERHGQLFNLINNNFIDKNGIKQDPLRTDLYFSEFIYTCEWPVPHPIEIECKFNNEQASGLPPGFISMSLDHHLKTISPVHDDGKRSYIFVADNKFSSKKINKNFRRGVKRVVNARLEDLGYSCEQDLRQSMEQIKANLSGITYLEGWGSLQDRAKRLERLVAKIVSRIRRSKDQDNPVNFGAISRLVGSFDGFRPITVGEVGCNDMVRELSEEMQESARRAAEFCLIGLGTLVGGEYPEFAREISAAYIRKYGQKNGHRSLGLDEPRQLDELERTVELSSPKIIVGGGLDLRACALIIADELERIAIFSIEGKLPSGSSDPFALRRSALRVIRELLRISQPSLPELLALVFERISADAEMDFPDEKITAARIKAAEFIYQRLSAGLHRLQDSEAEKKKISRLAEKTKRLCARVPAAVASAKRDYLINFLQDMKMNEQNMPVLSPVNQFAFLLSEKEKSKQVSFALPLKESLYNCVALADFLQQQNNGEVLLELHKRLHNIHDRKPWRWSSLTDEIQQISDHGERELSQKIHAELKNLLKLAGGRSADPDVKRTGKILAAINDEIATPANAFLDEYRLNAEDPKVKSRRQALAGAILASMDTIADMRKLYS